MSGAPRRVSKERARRREARAADTARRVAEARARTEREIEARRRRSPPDRRAPLAAATRPALVPPHPGAARDHRGRAARDRRRRVRAAGLLGAADRRRAARAAGHPGHRHDDPRTGAPDDLHPAARGRRRGRHRGPAGARRRRHRDPLRRPARGRAGLAARRRRLGAPGRPRRRVRPRLQRAAAGRGDRDAGRRTSSCPAGSGTTPRSPPRWPPAPAGSTSAPPRWSSRTGWPGRSAEHGDRIAVGLDVRGRHAVRPRLDPGRRRSLDDAGPAGRGRLRAVRGDRHPPGRRDGRAQPRPLPPAVRGDRGPGHRQRRRLVAGRPARAGRAGAARGGGRRGRQGPLRRRLHPPRGARGRPVRERRRTRCPRSGPSDGRGPGDPVPGRRRGAGGEGGQLHRPARRRRPGRDGPGVRRRGRRRADLPRHHRVQLRPGDHVRRGAPDRRAGVHPAHRRRRRPYRRRRRRAAAGRRGQGRGEHRGGGPTGVPARGRAPVRLAVHRAVDRRPARTGPLRGDDARRPPRHRHRRGRVGRGPRRSSAPARSCSTRWTPTAPGPATTWS